MQPLLENTCEAPVSSDALSHEGDTAFASDNIVTRDTGNTNTPTHNTLESRVVKEETKSSRVRPPKHRRLLHSALTYMPWRVSKQQATRGKPRNGTPPVNKHFQTPRGSLSLGEGAVRTNAANAKKVGSVKKTHDICKVKVDLEVKTSEVLLALQKTLKVYTTYYMLYIMSIIFLYKY